MQIDKLHGQIKCYIFTGGKDAFRSSCPGRFPPMVVTPHLSPQHHPWGAAGSLGQCYKWVITMTECFGDLCVFFLFKETALEKIESCNARLYPSLHEFTRGL